MNNIKWIENLKAEKSWTSLWYNQIYCGNCLGIFDNSNTKTCPLCNFTYEIKTYKIKGPSGEETIVGDALMGAIPRTAYLILKLMQEEWERPTSTKAKDRAFFRTSPKAIIVILFWTLFENLVNDLLVHGMSKLPKNVSEHLLKRHKNIEDRVENLYPAVFKTKFYEDIAHLDFAHLVLFLKEVQKKRNAFIHQDPEVIDNELVEKVLVNLQDLQYAWIKLYNLKCASPN